MAGDLDSRGGGRARVGSLAALTLCLGFSLDHDSPSGLQRPQLLVQTS